MPRRYVLALLLAALLANTAPAQQSPAASERTPTAPTPEELIKKLEATLTNVKLIGSFTVTGKEDRAPKPEEYTISSAMKLPEGDVWLIKARIKYGDKDVTVPMPLEIKWAGDTPIITLTDLAIPGLGTFTSRVVIYDNLYAGTWQHGAVGGHLFGRLEKAAAEKGGEKSTAGGPSNGKHQILNK